MEASLKDRVRAGEPMLGTFLNLGSPAAAEACAMGGFEWLLIDLEHGAGGYAELLGQLQAAAVHRVPAFVRVETTDRIRAGRVLDVGAAGVMFPRIDSAGDAAEAVAHLRYQPNGDRGVATYNRSCGFGLWPEKLDTADDEVIAIMQIESREALDDIEAIAAVPGVDALFVGPRDLSHALGIPGQVESPVFLEALARVLAVTQEAGIGAGILSGSRKQADGYVAQGFRLIGIGSDSSLLAAAARAESRAGGTADRR
jgi:2-dehydro-3-deoxyglucarate aldolase/4-hydroxy-2-oxoheptanedioate aldolase